MGLASKALGDRGEAWACAFLRSRGFEIVATKYRGAGGEIDIVARDGRDLHFIEVKTRESMNAGYPLEQLTPRKQRQIIRAAQAYRCQYHCEQLSPCFSVLGIDATRRPPELTWVPDAFEASATAL